MLVVVDAMVWIRQRWDSAAPQATSSQAFKRGDFECVASGPLVDEMAGVLFEEFGVPEDAVEDLVRLILRLAKVVSIKHHVMGCTDPNDDPVLETALAGGASVVVTRDSKLLNLPPHVDAYFPVRGIDIETQADFCRRLRALPQAPAPPALP